MNNLNYDVVDASKEGSKVTQHELPGGQVDGKTLSEK